METPYLDDAIKRHEKALKINMLSDGGKEALIEFKAIKHALRIHDVVGRSEQLFCPDCKLPFTKEELQLKEHCFNCGWEFTN